MTQRDMTSLSDELGRRGVGSSRVAESVVPPRRVGHCTNPGQGGPAAPLQAARTPRQGAGCLGHRWFSSLGEMVAQDLA